MSFASKTYDYSPFGAAMNAGGGFQNVMSSLKNTLFGTPGQIKPMPTQSPRQSDLFDQYLQGLQGQTGQAMDWNKQMLSGNDEAFANPAMRQFREQIMPSLSEQFSSMGSGGARNSSAFANAAAGQGAGLQERLALHKQGLQQQGFQNYQGMMNTGMGTKTFENMQIPGTEGIMKQLIQIIAAAYGGGGF